MKYPRIKWIESMPEDHCGIFLADMPPENRRIFWDKYYLNLDNLSMPCGQKVSYGKPEDVPVVDTPCPCGDPNHWLIKYGD